MATVSTAGGMTLIEQANRQHNGALLNIINPLSKTNKIMLYAQWAECNNGTTMKGTRVSTEPTGTWRDYDEGVSQGTGTTEPFEEPTGMLDHIFSIDKARLRHQPDKEKFFNDEIEIQQRGLVNQAIAAFFYGDRDSDTSFAGKIIRGITYRSQYNQLSSSYVYDNAGGNASATANKTSAYLMSFGSRKVELIYPRGDAMGDMQPDQNVDNQATPVEGWGMRMMRLQKDTALDANSKEYPAINMWYEQHWGICVHDYRFIRRIANISTTNIDEANDFSFNENYLIDAITDLPDRMNTVLAGNRSLEAQIWKRVKDSSARYFTESTDAFGEPVAKVCGVPFALCDAISSTESTVS